MTIKNNNTNNNLNTQKPITTDKVKTKKSKNITQINFNPEFQYDRTGPINDNDLSFVLNNEFIASFKTPYADLAMNEKIALKTTLSQIAMRLKLVFRDANLLDTISRSTIHAHSVTAFTTSDHNKLIRKAYSCFITYRLLYLLASLLYQLPISLDNTQSIKSNLLQITGMFALPNNTHCFINYVYNNSSYDEVVSNALNIIR